MKNFIFTVCLIACANSAVANTNNTLQNLTELCALDASSDENAYDNQFIELRTVDIKDAKSLTAAELKLVNAHLVGQEYIGEAWSFADIKELFTTGDQAYNDLKLITFKSKTSGKIYIQVKTWPGDNPYGIIFDGKSGEVLAHNGDDSITLITTSGTHSCWDLQK